MTDLRALALIRRFVVAGAFAAAGAATSAESLATFTDAAGCNLYSSPDGVRRLREIASQGRVQWEGACRNGFIDGPGILRHEGLVEENGRKRRYAFFLTGVARAGMREGTWIRETFNMFTDSQRYWTSLAVLRYSGSIARGSPQMREVRGNGDFSAAFRRYLAEADRELAQRAAAGAPTFAETGAPPPPPLEPAEPPVANALASGPGPVSPPAAAPAASPAPTPVLPPAPERASPAAPPVVASAPAPAVKPAAPSVAAPATPPVVAPAAAPAAVPSAPSPVATPAVATTSTPVAALAPAPTPPPAATPAPPPVAAVAPTAVATPATPSIAAQPSSPAPATAPATLPQTPNPQAGPAASPSAKPATTTAAPRSAPAKPAAPDAGGSLKSSSTLAQVSREEPRPDTGAGNPSRFSGSLSLGGGGGLRPSGGLGLRPREPVIATGPQLVEQIRGCYMDTINGTLASEPVTAKRGEPLRITGWAVDPDQKRIPERAWLRIASTSREGGLTAAIARNVDRPDVGKALGDDAYNASGFSIAVPTTALEPGDYIVGIIQQAGEAMLICQSMGRITLRQ